MIDEYRSTDKTILTLRGCSGDDVDKAVDAARKAFDSGGWSDLPPVERSQYIFKLAALIDRDRELLAAIDAQDCGK